MALKVLNIGTGPSLSSKRATNFNILKLLFPSYPKWEKCIINKIRSPCTLTHAHNYSGPKQA
jgi:hypothetical protein